MPALWWHNDSVLVPVSCMRSVPVPVVDVVRVPVVRHRYVTAIRPMFVGMALVGRVSIPLLSSG